MTRVLIVIILILIVAYLFNRWQQQRAAAQQREAEQQRLSTAQERQRAVTASAAAAGAAGAAATANRTEGLLQDAADTAMATNLGESTARLHAMTAELSQARQEAEAASERLAAQADAALEEIRQAAEGDGALDEPIEIDAELIDARGNVQDVVADVYAAPMGEGVPPGAVRGDGGRDCPPIYPVKGNRASMLYFDAGSPGYDQTVPEFCFSNAESALAAGFKVTPH